MVLSISEYVYWMVFLCAVALTELLSFTILNYVLLGFGITVGIVSLIMIFRLMPTYKQHLKELNQWGVRFFLAKVLPVSVALLLQAVHKL